MHTVTIPNSRVQTRIAEAEEHLEIQLTVEKTLINKLEKGGKSINQPPRQQLIGKKAV